MDLRFWLWTPPRAVVILVAMIQSQTEHEREFRAMCRRQLQRMSDRAISYQLTREVGGWEREEIEREAAKRGLR
jgi:hypothetical protein